MIWQGNLPAHPRFADEGYDFRVDDPVDTVFALAVAGAVASGEVALSGPAFELVQSLFLGA